MKFSALQFSFLNGILRTQPKMDKEGKPLRDEKGNFSIEARQFPLEKQADAATIAKKMFTHVEKKSVKNEKGVDQEVEVFVDADEEFSTSEKALILDCAKRDFDLREAEIAQDIRALLG